MLSDPQLPEQFSDLESFAQAWALETADQRLQKRMQSSMTEIKQFYNAMLPRLEEALNYLDDFEFGKLPAAQQRLYWICLSTAEAALSVEVYGSPTLPMAPEISRFEISHSNMDG
ncbi:MAG: nitrate reductase beta subunit [Gammaproteobacteria bacterium]|jgi:nitrate reductase beta subunit